MVQRKATFCVSKTRQVSRSRRTCDSEPGICLRSKLSRGDVPEGAKSKQKSHSSEWCTVRRCFAEQNSISKSLAIYVISSSARNDDSELGPVCEANCLGETSLKVPRANKKAIQVNGAPSGTRTRDPLIKSQLLYQLS